MKTTRFFAVVALAATLWSGGGAASAFDRFEVRTSGGVPAISVDGRPVRARIFWGCSGASPTLVGPTWRSVAYNFVAQADADGRGTIHFRFGREPGAVAIDNFSIVEAETGRAVAGPYSFENADDWENHWNFWDAQKGETTVATLGVEPNAGPDGSGALVVRLRDVPDDLDADFHVYHRWELDLRQGVEYAVRFDIRSETPNRRVYSTLYRPDESHVVIGAVPGALEKQVALAARSGVDFVSFMPDEKVWPRADGSFDWRNLDSFCDKILRANPNALLIPRLELDASREWLDANPDARVVWKNADGSAPTDRGDVGRDWATVSSKKYRATAAAALAAAIRHLESKYGNSIAGYHPAGQNSQEWFVPNTWGPGFTGYSPSDEAAFRDWLTRKYGSDAALQAAWNAPDATIANAVAPTPRERADAANVPYLNDLRLIDFNEFSQDETVDCVLELARTVRRETNGKKLSFFFYGYEYEFSAVEKGPAASGHYGFRRLLESPDVDVVCSPISYSDRAPGGGCCCMLNAESVLAAGKVYCYEDDTRTFLALDSTAPGFDSGADTAEATRELLLRDVGESAIRNFATWWMDLGGTGWFDSPELWATMDALAPIDRYFRENPTPYRPEIGIFLDEKAALRVSSGRYSAENVGELRTKLNRLGAPYGQYLVDDLTSGRVPAPKLCVVPLADALDAATKRAIVEKTNGATVLWLDWDAKTTTEKLRDAAREAGVWLYVQDDCVVWASGPFAVLHGVDDGDAAFRAPVATPKISDALSGATLSTTGTCVLTLTKGETRILKMERDESER